MNYLLLGARIRQERLKRKLTQEQLAELCNITSSYVGIIERGEKKLSVETLVKIASVLGVSVDYLLADSLEIPSETRIMELENIVRDIEPDSMNLMVDIMRTFASHKPKIK